MTQSRDGQIDAAHVPLPDLVVAPRTDAIYNCHGYLTKVPLAAILPFVDALTAPGHVVLDPFAGSGMTGIAAAMRGRRAHLFDISVLGRHIAKGYLTNVSPALMRSAAAQVVREARTALGDLYSTKRLADAATTEMVRTIWSFTYHCPRCQTRLIYFDALQNGGASQPDSCRDCGEPFSRRAWHRGDDVPVLVVVHNSVGRLSEQPVQQSDVEAISSAARDRRQEEVPNTTIDSDREMYRRSALGKHGMTETKRFFSPRNAIALLELWRAIARVADHRVRQKLMFAFTAILPRASRRYQWGPLRPLNAQNQTYYIAPVYYEWNVFDLFLRKTEAAIRSDQQIFHALPLFAAELERNVSYDIGSAHALDVPDESIDYVFTDPPFGSNIFYSDMNLFQEVWLKEMTDHKHEAVVHTSGQKRAGAAPRYEGILRDAFSECYRALKPNGFMSVVFGNSNGRMWGLVQRALRDAGFASVPYHVAILDKGQRSVKGLASGSEGVMTVDLILTVQKCTQSSKGVNHSVQSGVASELLDDALAKLDDGAAKNPSYVYAAIIREAIRRHQLVDNLHFTDVLIALRRAGYVVNPKSGLLDRPATLEAVSQSLSAAPDGRATR